MTLEDVMNYKKFVLIGDTLNKDKAAYKIKEELIKHNYQVSLIEEEYHSLNDIDDIEVVNLCVNPKKGLRLLSECNKKIKVVLIQPGAESLDIISYLKEKNIEYLEGCSLVGMKLYKNK